MPLTKDIHLICTAADEAAAAGALEASPGRERIATPRSCKDVGGTLAELTPFLVFLPEVKRVIYTTNLSR